MPTKIYHKDHGYVITSDSAEIKRIFDKGGKIIIKNKEVIGISLTNIPVIDLEEKVYTPEPNKYHNTLHRKHK